MGAHDVRRPHSYATDLKWMNRSQTLFESYLNKRFMNKHKKQIGYWVSNKWYLKKSVSYSMYEKLQ